MYEKLKKIIDGSDNIVFFGGAGVSTESGIPDFRSATGLYSHSPEYLVSRTYFEKDKEGFFEFYKKYLVYPDVKPNDAHRVLAYLEKIGKLKAVITQNIDGLHQMAGSKNVLELHGSIHRNHCMDCGTFYTLDEIMDRKGVPHCSKCNGIIKPNVTLYEEIPDMNSYDRAMHYITNADVLIIGGTSLVVQPAASLVDLYKGEKLILINKDSTRYNKRANLVISDKIGEVLKEME
ncbi:NAD-dependent protein deacylase [Psychrilyobacter sp.]|uniref:NAD-dependent protein deacylase n=1 Tax=Psychrilyobacter sp. TaxID=2586924 RepID=UPI003015A311